MTKISLLAAALALVVAPACKKKDADQAPAKTDNTPPATPGSGSAAMAAKPVEAPPVKPKTGKELADQYVACADQINTGKLDDFVKDCLDASYVGHQPDGKDIKADELKAHFTSMRAAFPDMKVSPQIVLVNGRTIYSVGMMSGTNEGEMKHEGMPAMPATHKKVGIFMAHKLAVNDANKVTEEWAFADPATMMFQLGLAPKEAPPHRAAVDKGMDGAPVIVVAADDAKEKGNLELIKKAEAAFNAHKPADFSALLTDKATESDQAHDKDVVGKKDIEKGLKDFQTAFSDVKITADDAAAGDFVYSIGTIEGTNDHDMGKMKKTGKHVSVKYTELQQIKDGKIDHVWRFYSSMEFAKQLGLMPDKGAAPAGGEAAKPGDKPGDKPADKKDDTKKPDGAKK
jgi:predicted ester cyclase